MRVRIPNAEIDELARQAERSGIFAVGEYTATSTILALGSVSQSPFDCRDALFEGE